MAFRTHRVALAAVVAVSALAACSGNADKARSEYLASGDRFATEKKYAEAAVQYRNAIQQDPKSGDARLKLAGVYEQIGDLQNAYRESIRAADAMPESVEAQVKAGTYLLAAGQFEDARSRAEKALAKDAKNVQAQIILGNALAGLKDFDGALKELEEAVKLDPKSASAFASLGSVQLAKGSRPEAETSFRTAVETNPKMAAAHMALANYLWAAGRREEAEASLKDALRVEPKNLLAHRALSVFYSVTGRLPEAEPHVKALADADTSPAAPLKLALADYYLAANREADAVKVLEGLAHGNKDSFAAARTRMAVIDYARKGPEQGRKGIDEVLAKDPKNVPALLIKARFLAADRKYDEALAQARAAAAADPASVQAHYLLGTIHRARSQTEDAIKAFGEVLKLNPRAVAAQVQLSELNLMKGARTPALELAQDASRQLPNDPAVQLTLVRTLVANGQAMRAQETMTALLQRFPNAAPVHAAAGSVALARRDVPGAKKAFSKAAELEPANLEALNGLLTIDFIEKKPEAARARVDDRLAGAPNDPRVLLLAGRVRTASGDPAGAEQFLRRAIEADPNAIDAFGLLAQIYASQKRLPEARASLEQVVQRRPEAVGPQTLIAMLFEAEGNAAEARRRYERVLQLDSAAGVAANNLAVIYATEGGNLDVALQLAQTAKSKLPDVPEVDDTLGFVYLRKQLPTLAIPPLEQAVRAKPTMALFQYHLGLAYAEAGEMIKARPVLQAALKLDPAAAEAAAAREALAASPRRGTDPRRYNLLDTAGDGPPPLHRD